jgi:hypothetical protein
VSRPAASWQIKRHFLHAGAGRVGGGNADADAAFVNTLRSADRGGPATSASLATLSIQRRSRMARPMKPSAGLLSSIPIIAPMRAKAQAEAVP